MRLWVSTAIVADLLKFSAALSAVLQYSGRQPFESVATTLGMNGRPPMNGDNDKSRLFSLLTVEEDEVAARGDSEDEELAEFSVVLSVFESKIERSFLA
ncbi:hypothetical protein X798_05212 [Onchocerca flexuosa]|uniref:Uncharacterized protein n=1 Tax=Onchocerca flexuosa TaxID=387005 RepID=A0A238BSH5_9BILA|nr:hypothetical protein X798_05212 [Onchocerca flexuosa]